MASDDSAHPCDDHHDDDDEEESKKVSQEAAFICSVQSWRGPGGESGAWVIFFEMSFISSNESFHQTWS